MIKIAIKGQAGDIRGFSIWGHARHGAYGRDIVCAGVSAVAITTLLGLDDNASRSMIKIAILPAGLIYVRLMAGMPREDHRDAQVLLASMIKGLQAIQDEHEDRIIFRFRR